MALDKKCILIVDDEENSRTGLSKILARSGYEVVTAGDGKEALDKVTEIDCHLVITDMKMPNMGGIELLKQVKKLKPNIGVIMVTAYGEVDSYLEAMNLGAFEYLNKPLRVDELKRVISKVLAEQQGGNA